MRRLSAWAMIYVTIAIVVMETVNDDALPFAWLFIRPTIPWTSVCHGSTVSVPHSACRPLEPEMPVVAGCRGIVVDSCALYDENPGLNPLGAIYLAAKLLHNSAWACTVNLAPASVNSADYPKALRLREGE